jgi:membrane protein required for colicin V production
VLFIGSWIGAGWVAMRFSKLIQPEVEKLVTSQELAYFISLLAVFVAALIVLVMVTSALSRTIRASPLRLPDKVMGAGFGVLCAWVAMGVAFLFYTYLGPRQLPAAVEGGATFPLIKEMANFVEPYLPTGFRTRLQQRPGTTEGGASPVPSPAAPAAPTAPANKPPQ